MYYPRTQATQKLNYLDEIPYNAKRMKEFLFVLSGEVCLRVVGDDGVPYDMSLTGVDESSGFRPTRACAHGPTVNRYLHAADIATGHQIDDIVRFLTDMNRPYDTPCMLSIPHVVSPLTERRQRFLETGMV